MSRYSNPNVTDIEEITGIYNSILENMKLLICNELLSVENSKKDISTKLKSPITDKTVRINEKYIPRYTTDNVANFIFVTNELIPFIIKMRNRRFCVLQLNEEFIQDKEYFTKLATEINTPGFYEHLFTYFMRDVDMSGFDPKNPPMTEAKKDIQDASKNPIETFVEEHYDLMLNEVTIRELFDSNIITSNEQYNTSKNPISMKERTFGVHIKKFSINVGWVWNIKKNKKITY